MILAGNAVAVIVIFFVLGVIALIVGWRGRRIDDHVSREFIIEDVPVVWIRD